MWTRQHQCCSININCVFCSVISVEINLMLLNYSTWVMFKILSCSTPCKVLCKYRCRCNSWSGDLVSLRETWRHWFLIQADSCLSCWFQFLSFPCTLCWELRYLVQGMHSIPCNGQLNLGVTLLNFKEVKFCNGAGPKGSLIFWY